MDITWVDDILLSGYTAILKNEINQAAEIHRIVVEYCTNNSYPQGLAGCYGLQARIYAKVSQWEEAIGEVRKSISILKESENKRYWAHQLYMLAYYYFKIEHYAACCDYAEQAVYLFAYCTIAMAKLTRFRSLRRHTDRNHIINIR
jgi:tetratricopeptide (TPR) repeat protein